MRRRLGSKVLWIQLAIAVVFLAAWQFLPQIGVLRSAGHVFDPYFVSSPSQVAGKLRDLMLGRDEVSLWSYLWPTVFASIAGTAIGMAAGAAVGLVLSNWQLTSDVFRPFIVAANATPRVALVPIVVIIAGTSLTSSVMIAVMVVFFVAFFNAYEGGSTIDPSVLANARLLGASPARLLLHVRLPYVLAWTFAGLPLAITFAVITVVTGELLTGYPGMGSLIGTATSTGQATLTWAVTIVLAAVGLVIVSLADFARNRLLHWWGK
jgi:NitT/TauT family transport system permease protein